jgi:hypothetical protein
LHKALPAALALAFRSQSARIDDCIGSSGKAPAADLAHHRRNRAVWSAKQKKNHILGIH